MSAPLRLMSLLEMLQISADAFGRTMYWLGMLRGSFSNAATRGLDPNTQKIGGVECEIYTDRIKELKVEVSKLSAYMAELEITRLIGLMERDECSLADFNVMVESIEKRLFDELGLRYSFALDAKEATLFESGSFGSSVATKFPILIDEISESYKCYALGRSTAAAFHAIRCLECGLAAMWRCLGIADPISGFERNWGNRMKKLVDQMEQKWPAKSGRMFGDAKFFDEAYASIAAMQNPYRNATMHFDAKYTLEEAWHIMELVKGFMQKISSRMDEDGLPLA